MYLKDGMKGRTMIHRPLGVTTAKMIRGMEHLSARKAERIGAFSS